MKSRFLLFLSVPLFVLGCGSGAPVGVRTHKPPPFWSAIYLSAPDTVERAGGTHFAQLNLLPIGRAQLMLRERGNPSIAWVAQLRVVPKSHDGFGLVCDGRYIYRTDGRGGVVLRQRTGAEPVLLGEADERDGAQKLLEDTESSPWVPAPFATCDGTEVEVLPKVLDGGTVVLTDQDKNVLWYPFDSEVYRGVFERAAEGTGQLSPWKGAEAVTDAAEVYESLRNDLLPVAQGQRFYRLRRWEMTHTEGAPSAQLRGELPAAPHPRALVREKATRYVYDQIERGEWLAPEPFELRFSGPAGDLGSLPWTEGALEIPSSATRIEVDYRMDPQVGFLRQILELDADGKVSKTEVQRIEIQPAP